MFYFRYALLSLCLWTSIQAEWDPKILQAYQSESLSHLPYRTLKKQIAQALVNSWCSQEKIDLLMDLTLLTGPQVCVEIGVFSGASLLPVAATLKYLKAGKVYAIDAWSNKEATRHTAVDDPNAAWWAQVDLQAVHNSFQKLIKTWKLEKTCQEIHKPSEQAVSHVPPQIDFLHLDGNYTESGSLRDVELYLPKVKSGGYILLSNFYMMIQREQPKIKTFCVLCDACEVVCSIENDNAVLFRKI